MSKRFTLGDQLIEANNKIAQLHEEKNVLVAEANKRINEAYQDGVNSTAEARTAYNSQIVDATEQIAKLTKELETAKGNSKYYSDRNSALNSQINHLHDLLDLVPDAIPRKKPDDQYSENTVAMRIMSYFVSQKK
jgi:chromosome segregation ATPase